MRLALLVVLVLAVVGPWAPLARAQEPAVVSASPSPEAPELVLRPAEGLERLARRVAATLSRRLGHPVPVGESPPGGIPEAVPEGHCALVPANEEASSLTLVYGGAGGEAYTTTIDLPSRRGDAAVRAIALSIESVVDAAADGPPPDDHPIDEESRYSTWTLIPMPEPEGIEPIAKPTIFLRVLFGYSPVQERVLVGPGAGLGLCVGPHCVVLEGDLPLVAEERTASDGVRIQYRPVNISIRGQFRPDWGGDFIPGASIGLLTRIGNASIEGTGTSQTASNLGIRATLELAWRFVKRFEWVIEAGIDVAVSRARFVRFEEVVILEDVWTPWFVTSLRLRPGS